MKHNYTDTQLQAAIDEAFPDVRREDKFPLDMSPSGYHWKEEAPNRLDLIKSALAALPEPMDEESMLLNLLAVIHRDGGHYQAEHGTRKAVEDACKEWQRLISIAEKTVLTEPPTVDGKTPGQVCFEAWKAGYPWEQANQRDFHRAASAVLAAFGKQSQPTEIPWTEWHGGECPLKDEEVDEWEYKLRDGFTICHPEKPRLYAWSHNKSSNDITAYRVLKWKAERGLSQLRPIAEAGEVPEGCVRYYTYKKDGKWTSATKHRAMQDTHYIDTRLPEPEPLVTKPISPPTWTPEIGDVVTLKSGGAKMTVVKLADTEGGLLAFLCEWFSDSGEYNSGVIYLTSLQPA